MGVSNTHYFGWLRAVSQEEQKQVREQFKNKGGFVIGLGESNFSSPFITDLCKDTSFVYQPFDLFPQDGKVLKGDINDLTPLIGKYQADVIICLRTSMFIQNKNKFLSQVAQICRQGTYVFFDFVIGSSLLPSIRWTNSASYQDTDCPFTASFYDDRLLKDFSHEIDLFCQHTRSLPLDFQFRNFLKSPRIWLEKTRSVLPLHPASFKEEMQKAFPPERLFSLADFEQHGFKVIRYEARYLYPQTHKFNLVNFVVGQYLKK